MMDLNSFFNMFDSDLSFGLMEALKSGEVQSAWFQFPDDSEIVIWFEREGKLYVEVHGGGLAEAFSLKRAEACAEILSQLLKGVPNEEIS